MKRLLCLLFCIVALGAFVGFGAHLHTGNNAASSAPIPQRSMVESARAVALTPMGGDTELDREIAEKQAKIRETPNSPQLLESLGWSFVAKARLTSDPGFYKLAEKTADALTSSAPDYLGADLLRGHVLHAMHRFSECEAVARRLTAAREFVFDYALLGDALMEQGKLDEAVNAYQRMVDLKPCLQTYSRVAHIRWLKGDVAGATAAARVAVTGGTSREPEPVAWAYTRLAFYELQIGNNQAAAADLDRAADFAPDYAATALMRGRALLAQSKFAEAVTPLERAAELSPLPECLWTLADALRAAGRANEAEQIEQKLRLTGASADPRTFALFLATRAQDAPHALELATAELETRHDVFTYDALAWSQLANGRTAEARASMQRALREGTQDARLFYHAGAIAAAAGEPRAALEFFNKAQRIAQTLLPSERQDLGARSAALVSATNNISAN